MSDQLVKMKLQDLIDASAEYDKYKEDYTSYNTDFMVGIRNLMLHSQHLFHMNEQPWLQMTKRLCTPFRDFSSSTMKWAYNHPELMNANFKYLMNRFSAREENAEWFIRTYQDGVRAILSPDYLALNNTTLLNTIAESLPHEESHVSKESIVTPDYLVLKMILRDFNTDTGDYGIGLMISNDEVGSGKLKFGGLIKRHSCDNSIVIPNRFAVFHRTNMYERLMEIVSQLPFIIDDTVKYVFQFEETKKIELTEINFLIETIAKNLSLSNEVKDQMFIGTEGQHNLFGLINGLTHSAKSLENELDRAELEEYSAAFLDMVNANQVMAYVR